MIGKLSSSSRVWLLITLITTSAAGGALHLPAEAIAGVPAHLPTWPLIIAFGFAEVFVVHLHLRRDAHSLSLNELPLLVGLAFLAPLPLLFARLVGAGTALVVVRRQKPTKLAFNLSLFALETVVGVAVFRAVLGAATPVQPRGWLAAVVAVVTVNTVGTLAVTAAIWLVEGAVYRSALDEVVTIGGFLSICNASVGILIVSVLWANPQSVIPMLAVSAMLWGGYRAFVDLRQRHTNLQMLHRFTSATARSGETRASAAEMLREVADLLRCDITALVLVDTNGMPALRVRMDHGQIIPEDQLPRVLSGAGTAVDVLSRDGTRLLGDGDHPALLDVLGEMDVEDAIVAPVRLPAAEDLRGVFVAVNRSVEISAFDDDDVGLMASMTGHAAVALENGRLVERLRGEAEERAHQALHDSLTGLPNRIHLQSQLDDALRSVLGEGEHIAVLLMDLDRFKVINDTLGHHIGDVLLQEVAQRVLSVTRPQDLVARLGGDEFAVLLRHLPDTEHARTVAEDIHRGLRAHCELEGITLDLHASIGVALAPEHGTQPGELLQHADVAMYQAKDAGGGVQVYIPQSDQNTHRRLALAAEVRNAVEQGQIDIHFQPKVSLQDGEVRGVEALARWTHPEFGRVGPDEFIPVAEQSGLIHTLTLDVIAAAMHARHRWALDGHEVDVAVNISPRTLVDLGFPAALRRVLSASPSPPTSLTLEMTETAVLAERERARRVMHDLSDMGVRLSIDDFGTGFSSLAHLKGLPLDEIKVDRSFVLNMLEEANDRVIVKSIIDLGHNLGMRVVAEGIEDEPTREVLAAMGCDTGQGFLWSAAQPSRDLELWLRGRALRRLATPAVFSQLSR